MIAGIIRLIIHKTIVEDKIPTILFEKTPSTNKATEPLTPISVIATVGVKVIKRKINIIESIDV